ncbi:MAG: hypothetical protein ACLFQV_11995 [Vulcanimicrobiota bacterium]
MIDRVGINNNYQGVSPQKKTEEKPGDENQVLDKFSKSDEEQQEYAKMRLIGPSMFANIAK